MYYFFFGIKFHVGNENTVYDRKHLYLADMKKKCWVISVMCKFLVS